MKFSLLLKVPWWSKLICIAIHYAHPKTLEYVEPQLNLFFSFAHMLRQCPQTMYSGLVSRTSRANCQVQWNSSNVWLEVLY